MAEWYCQGLEDVFRIFSLILSDDKAGMFFKFSLLKFTLLISCCLAIQRIQAQDLVIELGKKRLPITEYFTIAVKLQNESITSISDFPEIEGFQKSSRPKTRARITKAGKITTQDIITQNYAALKEGNYILKPFTIKVNGKNVSSKGTAILVQPELIINESSRSPVPDNPAIVTEKKPEKIKTESFLALETSKNKIYAGEGLRVQLYFYLASAEQGLLDFYKFGEQIPQLIKTIKPRNVWEESTESGEVKPDTLIIKGKPYIRFRLYESTYYPLSPEVFKLPALTLLMQQRPQDQNYTLTPAQPQTLPFTSAPKEIQVISLPPHPLRETVAIGQYQFREGISQRIVKVNKSMAYTFEITGMGNLSALNMPDTVGIPGLEVYPSPTQVYRNNTDPRAGKKTFRYTLLARKAGRYNLNRLFYLPYFNPATAQYDTLRSSLIIQVNGAANPEKVMKPEERDSFYKLIQTSDNELKDINQLAEIKLYTNLVILLLICACLYIFIKK